MDKVEYTEQERWLIEPKPGTAAAAARDFGIDLSLTVGNLRLTPEETLRRGLKFQFDTGVGDLDLRGEVRGVGTYKECLENAMPIDLFGHSFQVLSLEKLIAAKRTAGRTKESTGPAGTRSNSRI